MPATKKDLLLEANKVISALEKARKSNVIVYITGDRKPEILSTVIALDILPLLKKHLTALGKVKKLSFALYTNGGHLNAPWPIINLIREYCDELEVIVLDKALSAGTLIAMGADKIVMPPYSFLSPIDPAASIPDGNQQKRLEIEDIIGYIDFVKEKIGITEQQALCEIMKELTREVPPTKLGSVNRTHSLVRKIAKGLLSRHKEKVPDKQVKEIIETLTKELFSHDHFISRREAVEIGFENIIDFPSKESEKAISKLTDYYSKLLELENDFDPVSILGTKEKVELDLKRAALHSVKVKHNFESKCIVQKAVDPNGAQQVKVDLTTQKWSKI